LGLDTANFEARSFLARLGLVRHPSLSMGSPKRDRKHGRLVPPCLQCLESLTVTRIEGRPLKDLLAEFPHTDDRRNAVANALGQELFLRSVDGLTTWGVVSAISGDDVVIRVALAGVSPGDLAAAPAQWALAASEALDRLHARRREIAASRSPWDSAKRQRMLALMFAETHTAINLLHLLGAELNKSAEADGGLFGGMLARFEEATGAMLPRVRRRLEHSDRSRVDRFEADYGRPLAPMWWDPDGIGGLGGVDEASIMDVLPALVGELQALWLG
jgi:hypothetical protein